MATPDEVKDLFYKISSEGFDYALIDYSHWKEIEPVDPDLYKLIQNYQKVHRELFDYMNSKYPDELD